MIFHIFRHYDFLRILKCLTPFLSGSYRESNPINYHYFRNTQYFPWIICGKLGSSKENSAVTFLVAEFLISSLTKYVPGWWQLSLIALSNKICPSPAKFWVSSLMYIPRWDKHFKPDKLGEPAPTIVLQPSNNRTCPLNHTLSLHS